MPKCLDCGNTKKFYYSETQHCIATYDENGVLDDVVDNWYDKPFNGKCYECKKENVEGDL